MELASICRVPQFCRDRGGGTDGLNPLSSSGESGANRNFGGAPIFAGSRCCVFEVTATYKLHFKRHRGRQRFTQEVLPVSNPPPSSGESART
jgi:hypothetical protein